MEQTDQTASPAHDAAEIDDVARNAATSDAAGDRAAAWIGHMETEVDRFRTRWNEVKVELTAADARSAELKQTIDARNQELEALRSRLDEEKAAQADLQKSLAARDEQIRSLDGTIKDSQSESSGKQRDYQALETANEALRAEIMDLENYIEGRKAHWLELNKQLAQYRETLSGMEVVIRSHDVNIARKEQEKSALATRILELERRCAQADGRMTERDAENKSLQARLQEQASAHAQARQEFFRRAAEVDELYKDAARQEALVESLERGIARRDESIAALEADVGRKRADAETLANDNSKLQERLARLEESVEDRADTILGLREELKGAHQENNLLTTRIDVLEAKQMSTETGTSEDRNLLESVRKELNALQAEKTRLESENEAQQELIAQLETDLESKRQMISVFDSNAERLTILSQRLRQIDRGQIESGLNGEDDVEILEPLIDAALLFDEHETGANGTPQLDLVDVGDPGDRSIIDNLGFDRLNATPGRRLVMMNGDKDIEYPLSKSQVTIGRSSKSDICIRDVVVSRIHARLYAGDDGVTIEDFKSTNGILVNKKQTARARLHNGDIVSLGGRFDLRYVEESEDAAE